MDFRNSNAGIDMSVRSSIMQVKMKKTYFVAFAVIVLAASVFAERDLAELRGKISARPVPRPALAARLAEGPEIIGIVHIPAGYYRYDTETFALVSTRSGV